MPQPAPYHSQVSSSVSCVKLADNVVQPPLEQRRHLGVLDHGQLCSIASELGVKVGLDAPPHALDDDEIAAPCLSVKLGGHLWVACVRM